MRTITLSDKYVIKRHAAAQFLSRIANMQGPFSNTTIAATVAILHSHMDGQSFPVIKSDHSIVKFTCFDAVMTYDVNTSTVITVGYNWSQADKFPLTYRIPPNVSVDPCFDQLTKLIPHADEQVKVLKALSVVGLSHVRRSNWDIVGTVDKYVVRYSYGTNSIINISMV